MRKLFMIGITSFFILSLASATLARGAQGRENGEQKKQVIEKIRTLRKKGVLNPQVSDGALTLTLSHPDLKLRGEFMIEYHPQGGLSLRFSNRLKRMFFIDCPAEEGCVYGAPGGREVLYPKPKPIRGGSEPTLLELASLRASETLVFEQMIVTAAALIEDFSPNLALGSAYTQGPCAAQRLDCRQKICVGTPFRLEILCRCEGSEKSCRPRPKRPAAA